MLGQNSQNIGAFLEGPIYLVTEEIQNKAKLGFDLEIVINW